VLGVAGCLATAWSAQAAIMVDFGPAATQVVQSSWEGIDVTLASHVDVTPFGTVTHSATQLGGSWQSRDRAGSYPGGAANFVHPTLGQIGPLLQDTMKVDGGALDLHFTGLDAGSYDLTSFHHTWFGSAYNWAEFDILVDVDGNGFVELQSDLSVTHNGDDPITDPAIYTTRFYSPGPASNITVRFQPIAGTGDTTESPINGFLLDQVPIPEPGTGMMACFGLMSLASLRRRRRRN
jgi:uncharacterized protein (TIGR03382 family)